MDSKIHLLNLTCRSNVEGKPQPQMKIDSLSTHYYDDGGVGEVLSPQITFGVSGVKSIAAKSN